MKRRVTVVGRGYSARRFEQAFLRAGEVHGIPVAVCLLSRADVDRLRADHEACNEVIRDADVVINATNDDQHEHVFDVISQSEGVVVWEKPLLRPGGDQGEPEWPAPWAEAGRFALNCIERYSCAVDAFLDMVSERELTIARINFTWAKNRFDDPRPTVGVASEIIHPLDMACYLMRAAPAQMRIHHASTIASDYQSPSATALESVWVTAHIHDAVITGYSSFAHPGRRRVFELTLVGAHGRREYAELTFDEPVWDRDRFRHWDDSGPIRDEWLVSARHGDPETCGKLTRFASDILFGEENRRFTPLSEARSLQRMLDAFENAGGISLRYGGGDQRHAFDAQDLERLG